MRVHVEVRQHGREGQGGFAQARDRVGIGGDLNVDRSILVEGGDVEAAEVRGVGARREEGRGPEAVGSRSRDEAIDGLLNGLRLHHVANDEVASDATERVREGRGDGVAREGEAVAVESERAARELARVVIGEERA